MAWVPSFVTTKNADNQRINLPVFVDDPNGANLNVPMHSLASPIPTFNATNALLAGVPTSSVDWLQVKGSASKTIAILRIEVTPIPGAASPGSLILGLARRTATYVAGGGGTLETIAGASLPSGIAPSYELVTSAPTAEITVAQTFAATSSGTGGLISVKQIYFPGAAGAPQSVVWEFGTRGQEPLIVSGTGDFITLTFGQAATPQTGIIANIEFMEF
jgi:hypothetical protein